MPPTPTNPPLMSPDSVLDDLHCAACNYIIKYQPINSACPECGYSIQRTHQAQNHPLSIRKHSRQIRLGFSLTILTCLAAWPTFGLYYGTFTYQLLNWFTGNSPSPIPNPTTLSYIKDIRVLGVTTTAILLPFVIKFLLPHLAPCPRPTHYDLVRRIIPKIILCISLAFLLIASPFFFTRQIANALLSLINARDFYQWNETITHSLYCLSFSAPLLLAIAYHLIARMINRRPLIVLSYLTICITALCALAKISFGIYNQSINTSQLSTQAWQIYHILHAITGLLYLFSWTALASFALLLLPIVHKITIKAPTT